MDKILFLGSGSEKDPGFDRICFDGIPYKEYLGQKGITVIDKVVESCHGCYDLISEYSRKMQTLVETGNRVVAVLEGGLFFGLPSIQATQTTFPIISVPLDNIAYTAFMVPSGHAAIATVGIDTDLTQKTNALACAEKILNLENSLVGIADDFSNGRLQETLKKYDLKVEEVNPTGLTLAHNCCKYYQNPDRILVRADSDESVKDWNYLKRAEERHHLKHFNEAPALQVRGIENLAIFAAKIISLQRPELQRKIKEIGKKKRSTYKERNIYSEVMTI